MSQPSTISLERPAPKIATITFSNPPVNLVVGETVTRLRELSVELGDDPGIRVIVTAQAACLCAVGRLARVSRWSARARSWPRALCPSVCPYVVTRQLICG